MNNGTLHIYTADFPLISLNLTVGLRAYLDTSIQEQLLNLYELLDELFFLHLSKCEIAAELCLFCNILSFILCEVCGNQYIPK